MVNMFPEDALNKEKYEINIFFNSLPFPFLTQDKKSKFGQIIKWQFGQNFTHPWGKFKLYFLHKGHFIIIIDNYFSISDGLHYYL